jgi:hypothetical protein
VAGLGPAGRGAVEAAVVEFDAAAAAATARLLSCLRRKRKRK